MWSAGARTLCRGIRLVHPPSSYPASVLRLRLCVCAGRMSFSSASVLRAEDSRNNDGKKTTSPSTSTLPGTRPPSVTSPAPTVDPDSNHKTDVLKRPFHRTTEEELHNLAVEDLDDVSRETYVPVSDQKLVDTRPRSPLQRFRLSELRLYRGEGDQDGNIFGFVFAVFGISLALSYAVRIITFRDNAANGGELNLPYSKKEVFVYIGGPTRSASELIKAVSQKYGVALLDIYEILEMEQNSSSSKYGRVLRHCAEENIKVPPEIILAVLSTHLQNTDEDIVILHGFPRTISQLAMLEKEVCTVDAIISEKGLESISELDLSKQLQKEGRALNLPNETIQNSIHVMRNRIRVFNEETVPLLLNFSRKNALIVVDSDKLLNQPNKLENVEHRDDITPFKEVASFDKLIEEMNAVIGDSPRPKAFVVTKKTYLEERSPVKGLARFLPWGNNSNNIDKDVPESAPIANAKKSPRFEYLQKQQ